MFRCSFMIFQIKRTFGIKEQFQNVLMKNQFGQNQVAAVSNEKSLFTHRFNRWRLVKKRLRF